MNKQAFKALEGGEAATELLEDYEPRFAEVWDSYDWYFLYRALPEEYYTEKHLEPALLAGLWAGAVAQSRLEAELEALTQIVSEEKNCCLDEAQQIVEDILYDLEGQEVENCAREVGKLFTINKGWEKLAGVRKAEKHLDELIINIRKEVLGYGSLNPKIGE